MDIFEIIAERKIQEAIKKGDFDNLSGKGKPLEYEDLSGIDPADRMAYTILKNAGVLPPEVELRKAINDLEKRLRESDSEDEKKFIRMKLNRRVTELNILKERNRRK